MDFGYTEPTGDPLSEFSAYLQLDHTVLITWQTATETNIRGFNLYRSTELEGARTQLNQEVIQPQNLGQSWGASYEEVDSDVEGGVTYYYWLEVLQTGSEATEYGPEAVEIPLLPPENSYKFYLPITVK
jgi:hypothetical protein